MAGWVCAECTTTYSVGAPCCPHCGGTDYREQGEEHMPKITRLGGPSVAGITGGWSTNDTPDVWPAAEAPEPDADEAPAAQEGGEESSPGSSSSTSGEKPSTEPETSETAPRKRAPGTGSRSKRGRAENSTAGTTATPGPETDGADA